ncbi:MAG TPA: PQQ-binding-like beta-propeller repeat protein [Pyrinomonadaceae bacterium]|nr:PQQ-binding-like beta-propeller repeat protein [Pyrinomonadaceae bacterium]
MRVFDRGFFVRAGLALSLLLPAGSAGAQGQRQILSRPLGVVWKYETDETVNLTPAVSEGSVYLPLQNGEVIALRAADGELNWRAEVGGSISAAPAADEAALYVASENAGAEGEGPVKRRGAVRSLGQQSGVTLWLRTLPAPIRGQMVSDQTAVYGGAEDGRLYALKKATGELLWVRQHPAPFLSQPVLAAGRLYIGDEAGNLFAVEQQTGRTLWRYQTRKPFRAPVAAAADTVYAASHDGHVYALDAGTGSLRWRARTGGAVQSVAPAGRCLFVTSLDNFAYCLSPRKGYRVWKRQLPGRVAAQPLVTADGILLAPLSGEECVVLDPRDGRKLNSINVGEDNNTAAAPLLSGGLVLLTTRKGLYAYAGASARAGGPAGG